MKDRRNVLQVLAEWGEFGLLEAEGGFTYNVFTTPLAEARAYAEGVFERAGRLLDETLPNFDRNYEALRATGARALDVPRVDMPVIEPTDMAEFDKALKTGRLDIFKPYAKGQLYTPESMTPEEGAEWVTLGFKDGQERDDRLRAQWTRRAAKSLLPTQKQIWLEKLVGNIAKFGTPKLGSPVLETTIIVSQEGYILDGHHRFGQVMLADPNLKLRALVVPLNIQRLLQIGRAYGTAIGNEPKGRLREAKVGSAWAADPREFKAALENKFGKQLDVILRQGLLGRPLDDEVEAWVRDHGLSKREADALYDAAAKWVR